MRKRCPALLVALLTAPLLLNADVTIRYKIETASPMTPAANSNSISVIYMKGTKGVTVDDHKTTIMDFGRQEVTMLDTARKKFATLPVSEYSAAISAQMATMMPGAADGAAGMLKSMKTTCASKNSGRTETIQGIRAEEREVTCSMKMSMPEGMKDMMPTMGMNFVTHLWLASAEERVRVPGLWQLSGFELWQNQFMNPTAAFGAMAPDGLAPMMEAMQKDQSATLRYTMEMSMSMPRPGAAEPAPDTPMMKMSMEMVGLSTAPLDDALFSVPEGFRAASLEDVMNGAVEAAVQSSKAKAASARSTGAEPPRPENVKAYVPGLDPLTQNEPAAPEDANGKAIEGMVELLVTVGPKGNVEQAEALSGPEALRKAAADAVRHWTYRPVIRNGAPVSAFTEATVDFTDYSKGAPAMAGLRFTPDMAAAQERLAQLAEAFPRSPAQEFADVEQDAGGGDASRRYDRLGELASMAVKLGENEKAKAYANELLAAAQRDKEGWNYGNAIHDGHMVLGLVALRGGDISAANGHLLQAGGTPGSPQLNSFGPNMLLASQLLEKGERNTVLEYFGLCRKFWKMGTAKLDAWSETVRNGGTPSFQMNLR